MASFIALNSQFSTSTTASQNMAMVAMADIKPQAPKALSLADVIEEKAKANGVDPILADKIAYCESTGRQFNESGKVLRGLRNPSDVGLFQINEKYHLSKSKELGYDIYTTEGNIDYAMWLLKNEGSQHWNYSKPCWGNA